MRLPPAPIHSRGIALTPLLIFIALAVAATGMITAVTRSSTSFFNSAEKKAEINAALITKQVSDLKEGYRNAVASGWDPKEITLDEGSKGLYNPSYAFSPKQIIPESACAAQQGCSWKITTKLKASDVIPLATGVNKDSGSVTNNARTKFTYFNVVQQGAVDVIFVAEGIQPAVAVEVNKALDPTNAITINEHSILTTNLNWVDATGGAGAGSGSGSGTEVAHTIFNCMVSGSLESPTFCSDSLEGNPRLGPWHYRWPSVTVYTDEGCIVNNPIDGYETFAGYCLLYIDRGRNNVPS